MSNETDLDWLARNVHEWPAKCLGRVTVHGAQFTPYQHGEDEYTCDWTYKYMLYTESQWLARRAELQNKPGWKGAPEWAEWLAQNEDGEWKWLGGLPGKYVDGWTAVKIKGCCKGLVLGGWRDTLEKRPEQFNPSIEEANRLAKEFKPFTGIEDNQEQAMAQKQEMKQDNRWFERGELPPIGVVCEAYIDYPQRWVEAEIVAHKDGFAIGWCKSVMKGCHGDKASEFRPIRTERDELVNVFINHYGNPKGAEGYIGIADAILAAGFSLRAK